MPRLRHARHQIFSHDMPLREEREALLLRRYLRYDAISARYFRDIRYDYFAFALLRHYANAAYFRLCRKMRQLLVLPMFTARCCYMSERRYERWRRAIAARDDGACAAA